MEAFAAKWFSLYYPILGLLFLCGGLMLILKKRMCTIYLIKAGEDDQPPKLIISILKYFFLFSLPCLLLSFFPFSWPELLFSIWSLIIVFTAGSKLVHWSDLRHGIKERPHKIKKFVKNSGAIMLALAPIMFLLCYLVIKGASLH